MYDNFALAEHQLENTELVKEFSVLLKQFSFSLPSIGSSNALSDVIMLAISECLMTMEHHLKCKRIPESNSDQLDVYLFDKILESCKNKDMIRRALRQNQLTMLPMLKV